MTDYNITAGDYKLSTSKKTIVMGILNVTPDSFSDGSLYNIPEKAIKRALEIEKEGADVIDIGGESTRPFSKSVSAKDEIKRTIPIIKKLVSLINIPISIDTSKYSVAKAALDVGASIINDISALRNSTKMASLAVSYKAGLILMHMKGKPRTMQQHPIYNDVIKDVFNFLKKRIDYALEKGVDPSQIIIDPGIGFGKTLIHNLLLLKNIHTLKNLHKPILIGASRKSFIGTILNTNVNNRLAGSLATAVLAAEHGANLLRVHDVRETVRAIAVADKIKRI